MDTREQVAELFGVSVEWMESREKEYVEFLTQEVEVFLQDVNFLIDKLTCRIDPEYKAASLAEEKERIERELLEFYIFFDEEVKADRTPFRRLLAYEMRGIAKLESRLAWLTGSLRGRKGNGITDEMIARAKEYPFEKLVEIGRGGMIRCVFHQDKSPSMLIKNGFAFCFSCQKSWDSIQFVMDRENISFIEAVKRLQ